MPENHHGILVISLDFELFWGVRDHARLEACRQNLLGARRAVPTLLETFARHGIHATWATVGFLFFGTRAELLAGLPARKPQYRDPSLSPYPHLEHLGADESEDPFHFAASLVKQVAGCPGQEVGGHTFSHYYCLEAGQEAEDFRQDLAAARAAAARHHLALESLVFPRNQYSREYLEVCREMGIKAFRGNEASWLYRASRRDQQSLPRRLLRLLDSYVSLSSHNCASAEQVASGSPCNIPSSRFLRPYAPLLAWLEPLRRRRIVSAMTYAGRHRLVYHLWWHPENFGTHLEQNLAFLEGVLGAFDRLRQEHGMESLNMGELAARLARVPAAQPA